MTDYRHTRIEGAGNRRTPRRQQRRTGFSFIEILIVLGVISVLVALLLPAVQAAREAARRCKCNRNLAQVMLATQQYEMSFGVYPIGVVNNKRPIIEAPRGYHHSWIVKILPHLDHRNNYNHVDLQRSVYHAANAPVRQLQFEVLQCPSDYRNGPRSNYAGVHHDSEAPIDITNNGVFVLNRRIRSVDVTDGLSYTMFFGEKLIDERDLGWMSGTRGTLRNTGSPINSAPPVNVNIIQAQPRSLAEADRLPPAQRSPAVGGFSSHHPGGIQLVNGDGSCNFLSENIDLVTFKVRARRDNEPGDTRWVDTDDW